MAKLESSLVLSLVDKVSKPAGILQKRIAGLQDAVRANNARMDSMRGQLVGAAAAGYALFRGLSAPVTAAADFEASMNRVSAALQTSSTEFTQLSTLAKDMGKSTMYSANEAALAIEMLGKNGLATADILGGALKTSMDVAASSGADLSTAADITTDIMAAFKLRADQMTNAADGIAGVLVQSKFGIDDYRLALGQAGGVAGGLGVTLEDFNTSIAATSSYFASGSDAGTSYKTFLSRLVPASKSARNAMRKLGLQFFDKRGNMKSMADISQELQDGLKGLSDEAKNEYLQDIFGSDAIRTALGLAEVGSQRFKELQTTIGNTSAQEQAEARTKGFWGELEKLKSELEGTGIAIGEALLPALTRTAAALQPIVGRITSFAEANPRLTASIVALASGLIALRVAAIAAQFSLLWMKGGALSASIVALSSLGAAARAAATGFGLMKTAMTGGAARTAAVQAAAGARAMLDQKTAAFQSALAMRELAAGGRVAGVSLKDANQALSTAGREASAAQAAMAAASTQLRATGPAARTAAAGMMVLKGAATAVKLALIGTGIGAAVVAIAAAGTFIYQNWQGIQAMFAGIAEGISTAFPALAPIIDTVSSAVGILFGWFEKLTGPVDATTEQWRAFGVQIGTTIGEIIAKVAALPGQMLNALLAGAAALRDAGVAMMNALLEGLTSGAEAVMGYVAGMGGRIRDAIGGLASGAWEGAKNKAMGAYNAVTGGGGGAALDGARAAGGPVSQGGTYLVGEKGPEIFTPGRSGQIIPNDVFGQVSRRGSAAPSGNSNVTINVSMTVNEQRNGRELAADFSAKVQSAVQDALKNTRIDISGLHADLSRAY